MKRYRDPKATILFILIGASLMILIHLLTEGPVRAPPAPVKTPDALYEHSEIADFQLAAPSALKLEAPQNFGPPQPYGPPVPVFQETAGPLMPKIFKGKPDKIVIIIDDLGMDRRRTQAIVDLPGPLTLAFLPYAPNLPAITAEAKEKGHELLIHVPMEPLNGTLDPGPLALRSGMSHEAFDLTLQKIFESFDGYVGINNHMGSRLTEDREAMQRVIAALATRDLIFVDSKTSPNSVAENIAARAGLEHAGRDVFLDNKNDVAAVRRELAVLESIARKKGVSIAIGHPRDATIAALGSWLPGLKQRGFEIVPVSAAAQRTAHVIKTLGAPSPSAGLLPPP